MFADESSQTLPTLFELFSVTALNSFMFAFVNIFLNLFSTFREHRNFYIRFFLEYLAIFVPFVLTVTICNEFASIITPVLFILSLCIFTVCVLTGKKRTWNRSLPILSISESYKVPEVSRLYANLLICVCVAILAVDFRVFPIRFAKTSLYGWSLMDVGVGCFIIINAALSEDVRKPELLLNKQYRLKSTLTSCLPILLLGLQRLAVIKGIDYHQQVIEYGVHWNFFFTLSFTKMFASFVCCFVNRSDLILILAIVIGVTHQALLSCGLKNFIQNDDRNGLIAANKEGIFSLPGYISLYLLFVAIGKYWRRVILREKSADYVIDFVTEMPFLALFTGLLMAMSHFLIENVSRREANLGYICWMATLVIYLALVEHLFSLSVVYLIRRGAINRNSKLFNGHSIICAALAKNPLIVFLVANIITGIINIVFNTMSFHVSRSLFILFAYTFTLCCTAVFLDIKNMKLIIPTNINKFVHF